MINKQIFKNYEEWAAYRTGRPLLGSSDVGYILGVNPYESPYQYWRRKRLELAGNGVETEADKVANLMRGRFKEEAIAREFEAATGEKVIKESAALVTYTNSELPEWVQASPDRELFSKRRGKRAILECKDSRRFFDVLDAETTPKEWYAQIQWQMGVMRRDAAYIAVEDGNKQLRYARFGFDSAVFDHILNYCSEWFERYILGDDTPPLTTGADVETVFPVARPEAVQVDAGIFEAVEKYKALAARKKELEKEMSELADALKVGAGACEVAEYAGSTLYTFKTVTKSGLDLERLKNEHPEIVEAYQKTTSYRTLRVK